MPDPNYIVAPSLASAALEYARHGWAVFPLKPGGKDPLLDGGVNSATTDLGKIKAWWTKHPKANIGIALRASGLGVVDVDIKPHKGVDGRPLLRSLIGKHGKLGLTCIQKSAGGGRHMLFQRDGDEYIDCAHWPPERRENKKTGVDLFTARHRYIAASPSVLDDGRDYRWLTELAPWDEVGALPQAWRELVRAAQPGQRTHERHAGEADLLDVVALRVPGVGLDELNSILEALPPEMPRDEWLRVLWGAAAQWSGTKDEALVVAKLEEWSSKTTRPEHYKEGEVEKRWEEHSASAGGRSGVGHVTWRSVRNMAREHGWTPFSMGSVDAKNWKASLNIKKTDDGRQQVLATAWNCALTLAFHKKFAGSVRRNVLTNAIEMHHSIVCPLRDPTRLPMEFKKDSDWVGVSQSLKVAINGAPMKDAVVPAVAAAADVHAYDPMKQWVESLVWDGTPRLDAWLPKVTGCMNSDLNRRIGRKWLIGLAGRATTEYDGRGVKMDSVLVLQGDEGIGKSTIGAVLGGEWYSSFSNSLDNENIYYVIERCMVLEFDELDAMSRSEATRVKSLVTTQADTFRRKYDPNAAVKPRRCVFIGTTNDSAFLTKDMTARRWWVVRCGKQRFDLRWLQQNREQLIAEAVVAMRKGELPVLEQDVHAAQRAAVGEVLMSHPYEEAVNGWTRTCDGQSFTTSQAVEGALGRSMVSLSMSELRKFGECMRACGWEKVKKEAGNVWVKDLGL